MQGSPHAISLCATPKQAYPLTRSLCCSLELLLGAKVIGVAALLLATVHSTGMETCVAFAANHLLAIVLAGEHGQGRLDHTSQGGRSRHKLRSTS